MNDLAKIDDKAAAELSCDGLCDGCRGETGYIKAGDCFDCSGDGKCHKPCGKAFEAKRNQASAEYRARTGLG